jgi:uncharacterized protein YodC (DUF2158 family)
MINQKFIIGDEVKHKSGGPLMVVREYEPADGDQVTCEWFDQKDIRQEGSFHQDTLKKYEPPKPPKIRFSSI